MNESGGILQIHICEDSGSHIWNLTAEVLGGITLKPQKSRYRQSFCLCCPKNSRVCALGVGGLPPFETCMGGTSSHVGPGRAQVSRDVQVLRWGLLHQSHLDVPLRSSTRVSGSRSKQMHRARTCGGCGPG